MYEFKMCYFGLSKKLWRRFLIVLMETNNNNLKKSPLKEVGASLFSHTSGHLHLTVLITLRCKLSPRWHQGQAIVIEFTWIKWLSYNLTNAKCYYDSQPGSLTLDQCCKLINNQCFLHIYMFHIYIYIKPVLVTLQHVSIHYIFSSMWLFMFQPDYKSQWQPAPTGH